MQYVIMDLEWNNTYAKKTSVFINEIIEIGAVKLDENFNQIDTFSCIIRSQIGYKLRGSVKKLTNLTNADISSGLPFTKAFSIFRKWIGSSDTVILTWGDGDIRVLIENFSYLNGITVIPFLHYYCDLQHLYQVKFNGAPGKQAGLSAAAESLGINPESFEHHRALDDSKLTVEVFKKVCEKGLEDNEFFLCNDEFYDRLLFKAKIIKNLDNPLVDKKKLDHYCNNCGKQCEIIDQWKFSGQYFKAKFECSECGTKYNVKVRFKKHYDSVDFKKIVSEVTEIPDEEEDDDE